MLLRVRRAWVVLIFLLTACGGGSSLGPMSVSPRPPGPLGDTWTNDGSRWVHVHVSGPLPRYFAALAYDSPRHVFVLFGGQTAKGTSGDTWTWDPRRSKWREMSPAHKPPPRRDAAMAYDPGRQVIVLSRGLIPDQGGGHEAAATWTWNGSDWTEASAGNLGPG